MDSSDDSRGCCLEHELAAMGRWLRRVKEGVKNQKRQLCRFRGEMEERLELVEENIHKTKVGQMEQAAAADSRFQEHAQVIQKF